MGAAAGTARGASPPERSFYCHSCFNYVGVHGDSHGGFICSRCESTFVEEAVTDANGSLENALDESLELLNSSNSNTPLNTQQAMRLASTAAMLRIFESQLRQELEALQPYLNRQRDGPSLVKPLSCTMKRKLRKVKVTKQHCDEQQVCPICSEENVIETDTLLLQCGHIFHEACVMPWLEMKKTCPLCRHELDDSLLSLQDLEKYSEREIRILITDIVKNKKSALAGDILRDDMNRLYSKHSRLLEQAAGDDDESLAEEERVIASLRDALAELLHRELQIEHNSIPKDRGGQLDGIEQPAPDFDSDAAYTALSRILGRRRHVRLPEPARPGDVAAPLEGSFPGLGFSPITAQSAGSLDVYPEHPEYQRHIVMAPRDDSSPSINFFESIEGSPSLGGRAASSEERVSSDGMFRRADSGAPVPSNSFIIGNTYVLRSSGSAGAHFTATPVQQRGDAALQHGNL